MLPYIWVISVTKDSAVSPEIVLKIIVPDTTDVTLEIAPDRCNMVLPF